MWLNNVCLTSDFKLIYEKTTQLRSAYIDIMFYLSSKEFISKNIVKLFQKVKTKICSAPFRLLLGAAKDLFANW